MCEYVSLGKENKSKIKQIRQIKLKSFCFQETIKKKKERETATYWMEEVIFKQYYPIILVNSQYRQKAHTT